MHLRVDQLSFSYGQTSILSEINIHAEAGEFIGILGPNGVGKTTLLKCLNRILVPSQGTIHFDQIPLDQMNRRDIAKLIAVVSQHLGPLELSWTVLELTLLGRTPHLRLFERENKDDFEIAWQSLQKVKMTHLADRRVDELSGGELRRVMIAMALTQDPRLLLMDEPTIHLDLSHQLEILQLIRSLCKSQDLLVLSVFHDLFLASRFCDRVILLHKGQIWASGTPQEVLVPENISAVFGVESQLVQVTKLGIPIIVPLHSLEKYNSE
ncbi:MAG: ABC transporter ATP-binding protein [Candidatus Hodarchaeota archaeon]